MLSFCSLSTRCKMRILDSFGTDAQFNYPYYKENIPGGRSPWGDLNLRLPQFMTMFRKSQKMYQHAYSQQYSLKVSFGTS